MRTQALIIATLIPNFLTAAADINHEQLNKLLFTTIYERNSWGSPESKSGEGSSLKKTMNVRSWLPVIFEKLKIKTMLDAPCGDFNWMQHVNLSSLESYIGLDIVAPLIEQNMTHHKSTQKMFFCVDIINSPLPKVDLILCRDCMQHLLDTDVFKLLSNIKKSGSKYVLMSNYFDITENKDIDAPYSTARITYRNLTLPPFNLPKPIIYFEEEFDHKSMALWQIDQLPSYK